MKNGRILALLLSLPCLPLATSLTQDDLRPRQLYFVARENQPLYCKPLAYGGYKGRLTKGQTLGIRSTKGLWKNVEGDGQEGWVLVPAERRIGGANVSDEYLNSAVTATIGSGLVTKGFGEVYSKTSGEDPKLAAASVEALEVERFDVPEYDAFLRAGKLPVDDLVLAASPDETGDAGEASESSGAEPDGGAPGSEEAAPIGDGMPRVVDDLRAAANKKRDSMQMTQDPFYFSRRVSYEDERQIGLGVAQRLAAGRIHEGEALTRYISLIGAAIVEKCDRSDIPYRFLVLDGDEVNAFAAPGGFIFITTGCIRACKSEAELAGVLAHEVAHVARRHGLRIMDKNRLQIAKRIKRAELDRVIEKYMGGMDREKAETLRELTGLADESYKYCTQSWGQEFELEADAYGLRYATAVGWDYRGLFRFLDTLGMGSRAHISLGQAFSSHPSVPERIKHLKEVVRIDGMRASNVFLEDRFVEQCASVR